jgi:hypothetical protein
MYVQRQYQGVFANFGMNLPILPLSGAFGGFAAKSTRYKQYFLPVAFDSGRAKSDRQKG